MATTKSSKTPDLNKKEVREALHGEHNSRGRGRAVIRRLFMSMKLGHESNVAQS